MHIILLACFGGIAVDEGCPGLNRDLVAQCLTQKRPGHHSNLLEPSAERIWVGLTGQGRNVAGRNVAGS